MVEGNVLIRNGNVVVKRYDWLGMIGYVTTDQATLQVKRTSSVHRVCE